MKQDNEPFKFSPSVVLWPLVAILSIWICYWAEIKYHLYLTQYGILPRTFTGLRGILLSPFLHGSLEHIYNNSIPLFLLIAAMRYFYRRYTLQVIFYGILISGFLTWLIGRGGSYHIGASGLIYVLVSFIFFKGIQTGYYRLVALSLTIVLLYGSMLWYVFPGVDEDISWEGHLGGFIAGLLFSKAYDTPEYKNTHIVYDWQKPGFDPKTDPFMKRFDENGNFVNPPKPEDIEVVDAEILSPIPTTTFPVHVIYVYKTNTDEA
jgi:membrane associated rhomboid family serine protease